MLSLDMDSELLVPVSGQSQSYTTTDGQLASLSWCQGPVTNFSPFSL
jgi:hypothetical protein